MAVTSSQDNGDGVARFASGSYLDTGTAAAINIDCGFRPRYVKVVNVTVAGESGCAVEWFDGMTDAYAYKTHDAGSSEAGFAVITSLGITPDSRGFTIGLDTDLNVTSEQLHWIAIG
jgi:hypothetical protein